MKYLTTTLLFCLVVFNACKDDKNNGQPNPNPGSDTTVTSTINCIPGTANCVEVQAAGDPYFTISGGGTSPLSGYADPCIRKDPQSNTWWMIYSWPNLRKVNNVITACIDSHLASSTDSGNTWNFVKPIWPAVATTNPDNSNQQGLLVNETPFILPTLQNSTVTWYGARHTYLMVNNGNGSKHVVTTEQIRIYKATTPEGLETAPYSILSTSLLTPGWKGTQNLALLDASINNVTLWGEPSLYFEKDTLYLTVVSFVYNVGNIPDMTQNNVHVFATVPNGDPASWQWAYKGKLAGQAEATELGGQGLTQVEITKGKDGKLLMITSPEDWDTGLADYNHKGCKVVEIKSLGNPALERDSRGKLRVRVAISQSDAYELGSGSSSYEPLSNTGILFARRLKTTGQLTSQIWKTGIRP